MRLFGLVGYPLTHSFSQKYFTEKFALLGLSKECSYENFSIPSIEELSILLLQKNSYMDLILPSHTRNK